MKKPKVTPPPEEIFATLTCIDKHKLKHGSRVTLRVSTNETNTEDNTFSKSDKPSIELTLAVTNPEFADFFKRWDDYTITISKRYT